MKVKPIIFIVLLILMSSLVLGSTNMFNTNNGVYSEAGSVAYYSGSSTSTDYTITKSEGEVSINSYGRYTNILSIPYNTNNLNFNLTSYFDPREGNSEFRVLLNGVQIYSSGAGNYNEYVSLNISSYYGLNNINLSFSNYRTATNYGYNNYFNPRNIDLSTPYDTFFIQAKDINGSQLLSFSATINGTTYSTTNGTIITPLNFNDTNLYTINYSAGGYFDRSYSSVNLSNYFKIGELYKTNSVNINIYNENTNTLLTSNVTLVLSSSLNTYTYTTTSGNYYIDNIQNDTYLVTASTPLYSSRSYSLVIGDRTDQNLNVYLLNATTDESTTIITKAQSGSALEGVSLVMSRFINSSWTTVESKYSDVAGNSVFNYNPSTNYRFILDKDGYEQKIFYLNPITEPSYTVTMVQNASFNYTSDFDGVNILYTPKVFQNNNITKFDFLFSSPSGNLVTYGYNISYPDNSNVSSGSLALGSQLTSYINITNAEYQDVVQLNYYYTTTTSGLREFSVNLPILVEQANGTMIDNIGKDYGLTLFERILIVTIIIIFVVGIASMVGNPLAGLILALFLLSYFVYIGFIPTSAILLPIFIGIFFILWRGII